MKAYNKNRIDLIDDSKLFEAISKMVLFVAICLAFAFSFYFLDKFFKNQGFPVDGGGYTFAFIISYLVCIYVGFKGDRLVYRAYVYIALRNTRKQFKKLKDGEGIVDEALGAEIKIGGFFTILLMIYLIYLILGTIAQIIF